VVPEYTPLSPDPVVPENTPISPDPVVPEYTPLSPDSVVPEYTPISQDPVFPKYIPVCLASDSPSSSEYTYTELQPVARSMMYHVVPPTQTISPSTPGVSETQTLASGLSPIWRGSSEYPLKEELKALIEIVDSVRVDLLQTSMLINYIADFMKKIH
jgi:hypothetical protein